MAFIGASFTLHRMKMREMEHGYAEQEAMERIRQQRLIDKEIQESDLFTLNADKLRTSIQNACQIYIYDDNNKNHAVKNFLTAGHSSLFRQNKADTRSKPWIEDLDQGKEPSQVLLAILKGPGGKNVDSLKYQILSELTNLHAKNYEAAKLFIDRTMYALNHPPELIHPHEY